MLGQGSIAINIFLLSTLWLGIFASDATPSTEDDVYRYVKLPCPNEWDLSPCTCVGYEADKIPTTLNCSNVSSLEVLQNVLSKITQPSELEEFYLEHSEIKSLPDGFFGKTVFQDVTFYHNAIEKIEPGIFKEIADNITHLTFYTNKIKVFDFFSEAKNLEAVYIYGEQCDQLGDYMLANFPKMDFLYISTCPIHTIGNYVFANTTGSIGIVHNLVPLQNIGDSIFSHSNGSYNEEIDLWNITDGSLSTNTFTGMRAENLTIGGLTTLKEEFFSPLITEGRAKFIEIIEPLTCDKSMDWIINNKTARQQIVFQCENESKN